MAVQMLSGGISGTLSRIFGLAPSHLTQKCLSSVAHEFMILGIEISSLSYHLFVMLPTPRWQTRDSHFPSSVQCVWQVKQVSRYVRNACRASLGHWSPWNMHIFSRGKWGEPEKRSKKYLKKLLKIW